MDAATRPTLSNTETAELIEPVVNVCANCNKPIPAWMDYCLECEQGIDE